MSVARSVAEVLERHVTLEVECIDRMYLNAYVPILQTEGGWRTSSANTSATASRRRR